MSELVYGIDLGTTYSAIARINDQGAAEVVNNFEGSTATPSAVFFEGGDNIVVGAEAKRVALSDPDNTCMLIKRHMGTDHELTYEGKEWTPESISALILRELVNAANQESGQDASKVVITVPAYFGVQEREATRQAGEIAGLDVVGIVTEPVAAALSLGIRGESAETILVYDLGGGTFDTTIMAVESGKVEVVAVDGNRTLGGADWDDALVELIIDRFAEQAGIDTSGPASDDEFMLELRLDTEETKKSLTKREKVTVRCVWEEHKEMVEVTRAEFESATEHLLSQTLEICERALETAKGKRPGLTIDRVLLVGGSSRMPMVSAALKDKLGWDAEPTDFDLAVAKGAAIYGQAAVDEVLAAEGQDASALGSGEKKFFLGGAASLEVTNVLSRGVGLEFVDPDRGMKKHISFVAHTNETLPLEPDPISAATVADNQTSVNLALYEQGGDEESEEPEDNRQLKEVDLPFARPMPKGSPIDINMTITSEGLIRVKAVDPESGASVDMEATVSVLDEEQVSQAASQVAGMTLRS